jgi:beta-glucosidase/6-phospho-beta-glucosidase/beta-galactosidase/glycosyltransferase involved in cell wall biosynthesis
MDQPGTWATGTPQGGTSFIGGFDSTFLPVHGVDMAETSQHSSRWRHDLDAVLGSGVKRFRYPLRWHRIEPEPGVYDWSDTDAALDHLRQHGAEVIADLVHHTSYPDWLTDGFRDRRFGPAFVSFAEAVASRYPWLPAYTLFNEPFATLFLAGHQSLWPPYDRGVDGFVRLATNVLPAISSASECWSQLLPDSQHIWVDTCEHHAGRPGSPADYAAMANDRRHVLLDLALGRNLDPSSQSFLAQMLAAGGESLLELAPTRVDGIGLDYYPHSEWWYDQRGGHAPSSHPLGFAALAEQYASRYHLPLLLTETNIRGLPSDRVSWLRYTLEQYDLAVSRGVPLRGYCWFPSLDSCDWDSLLARGVGRPDPVGVISLGFEGARVRTHFTDVWEAAVAGLPTTQLPAYRFQPPCDRQLAGFTEQLDHWPWEDPPAEGTPAAIAIRTEKRITMPTPPDDTSTTPDLVVLSHLRWTWVWQRPQQLVSRFAAQRAASGARTWFVEEPKARDVSRPELRTKERDGVTRIRLVIPRTAHTKGPLGFHAEGAETYGGLLADYLAEHGVHRPDVMLYTPMALDLAAQLSPQRLFYDVMDDLASFKKAPEGMILRQRRALGESDIVFSGGRSLHRSILRHRNGPCHFFPSGVDTAHYASSRTMRTPHSRPVAGYVGVIDERMDLTLLAELAAALPDWSIRVVGPVAKIKKSSLPRAENLKYPGMVSYAELPKVMAGFDVAVMPFALNEATRSISPTKTLEYLAAGLPVVSTRVPDVVADYDGVVHFADDGEGFAQACRDLLGHSSRENDRRALAIARRHEWDAIAERMGGLMAASRASDDVREAQG